MLDLDSLADKRAQVLNQKQDSWRKAIWSDPFQKLTQNMSDGEVESLIAFCPSAAHLENVVRLLEERIKESGKPPFSVLTEEAVKAGLTPEEWIRKSLASGPHS